MVKTSDYHLWKLVNRYDEVIIQWFCLHIWFLGLLEVSTNRIPFVHPPDPVLADVFHGERRVLPQLLVFLLGLAPGKDAVHWNWHQLDPNLIIWGRVILWKTKYRGLFHYEYDICVASNNNKSDLPLLFHELIMSYVYDRSTFLILYYIN